MLAVTIEEVAVTGREGSREAGLEVPTDVRQRTDEPAAGPEHRR
jgi:hypothetical protein